MSNVTVGDLAIVVRDGGKKENLGLIVKVLEYDGMRRWEGFGEHKTWVVECAGRRLLCYMDWSDRLYFLRVGKMPDCCLKPIRPDREFDDDEANELLDQSVANPA